MDAPCSVWRTISLVGFESILICSGCWEIEEPFRILVFGVQAPRVKGSALEYRSGSELGSR